MKLGCISIELLPDDAPEGCGGKYRLVSDEDGRRPVYKHISKDRYILYTENGSRIGWGCGSTPTSGGVFFIQSKSL
jgi:hypothetical protein